MEKRLLLKNVFGHDSFRPSQEKIVDALLAGQDVLAVMPTGSGKSICYQLPALMMEGITLIVSPLISLMSDQVMALKAVGVAAAYLNSSLTLSQQAEAIRRARRGAYKLIYVAPERLLVPQFISFARESRIAMLAVDEAHCVSQWGQDFRPSYRLIPEFVHSLPKRPIVAAFTATATRAVRQDIAALLELRSPMELTTGYDRPNLHFTSIRPTNRFDALCSLLKTYPDESGIVYCNTRKTAEQVCGKLRYDGYSAICYHGGMDAETRKQNQEKFQCDQSRIMVATNAFGMGIDKPNVRFVVHYNMPRDLESYYQEAGRAGRDGGPAECMLLYSPQDIITGKWMIEHGQDEIQADSRLSEDLKRRELERLNRMVDYATSGTCLRRRLLDYFGEYSGEVWCGNCSVCDGTPFEVAPRMEHRMLSQKEREALSLEDKIRNRKSNQSKRSMKSGLTGYEKAVLENLMTLRKVIASRSKCQPAMVFSDETLSDLARQRPITKEALLQIDGVGRVKQELYGEAFLSILRDGKEPNDAAELYLSSAPVQEQMKRKSRSAGRKGPAARSGLEWTAQEEEQLRKEYAGGDSISRMAEKHERGEGAVREMLRSMRLLND